VVSSTRVKGRKEERKKEGKRKKERKEEGKRKKERKEGDHL